MAGSGKRGGDRVLESRHLVVFFLGVVILCGVFFTLGYVMGHNQYGGSVHAADSPEQIVPIPHPAAKPTAPDAPAASSPANNEWDFYAKNSNNHIDTAAKPSSDVTSSSPAGDAGTNDSEPATNARTVPASARFQPPRMFKGSVVLQIAALTHQSDALAMADVLQQKKFPGFVVAPTTDNFYRVQVGPYPDERAAESARNALDQAGFKAIIKR